MADTNTGQIKSFLDDPCVQELWRLFAANPYLKSAYKTLVLSVVAMLEGTIAAAEMVITQYVVVLDVEATLLQTYDAIVQSTLSQLNIIPWNQFKQCAGVSNLVGFFNTQVDPYNIQIPFTNPPVIINLQAKKYDYARKKAWLQFLQNEQKARQQFKKDLLTSLSVIDNVKAK